MDDGRTMFAAIENYLKSVGDRPVNIIDELIPELLKRGVDLGSDPARYKRVVLTCLRMNMGDLNIGKGDQNNLTVQLPEDWEEKKRRWADGEPKFVWTPPDNDKP